MNNKSFEELLNDTDEIIIKPEKVNEYEAWTKSHEYITREEYIEFYTKEEAGLLSLIMEVRAGAIIEENDRVRYATWIEFNRKRMEEYYNDGKE